MFSSTQQCCGEQELQDAHGRLAVLHSELRGPVAFAHRRTRTEGSFMTLRKHKIQQNVVTNQDPWQLGEDGVVRESTSCEQKVEPKKEQHESVHAREGRSRSAKKNGNWSDDQLHYAKRAIDNGAQITSAADYYGIPHSTLRSHIHGITLGRKRGKSSMLTESEERKLVTYLHDMANWGFPLTWLQLKIKVASLVQDGRETPFEDGIPGSG